MSAIDTPDIPGSGPAHSPFIPDGSPTSIALVVPVAPLGSPSPNPNRRKDKRPTFTLKGEEFGPEFRALINKAAERAGMTQAQFVAETMRRESQRIIKGDADGTATDTPIALPTERLDAQDRRLTELADQVRRLTEMQQHTLWRRLKEMLATRVFDIAADQARNPTQIDSTEKLETSR